MGAVDDRALNRQSSLWDKVQEQFPINLDLNARGADGATPQAPGNESENLRDASASPNAQTVWVPAAACSCAAGSGAAEFDTTLHLGLQGRLGGGPTTAASTPEPLLKRLVHTELSPQQVVLRDKFGFVAGIGNIA